MIGVKGKETERGKKRGVGGRGEVREEIELLSIFRSSPKMSCLI